MQKIEPDVIIFPQLDLDAALERLKKRELPLSAFEQQRSFMQKIEHGFKTLYKKRDDVILIDANQTPQEMANQAHNALVEWLTQKNLITTVSPQNSGLAQTKIWR